MPYSYLTIDDTALNAGMASGSYFPKNLQELYEQKYNSDEKYFGTSDSDLVEFTLYNSSQEPIAFNRVVPTVSYSVVQGSYYDINNTLAHYSFAKPFTNFTKFNNELLLDTQDVIRKTQISPGLYHVLYNFMRNMAGDDQNKLVIKEISPSRTELRLSFAFNPSLSAKASLAATKISAFADKKYLFLEISSLVNQIIDDNPISQTFISNETNYNYLQIAQNLGLKSAAQLQQFIIDTYTGFDKIQNLSNATDQVVQQSTKFIGIDDQLKNFTYTYNSTEFSKSEILLAFKTIVTKVSQDRVLQKTSINAAQLQTTLDVFVKLIYTDWLEPKLTYLLDDYSNRFFGLYKNALNFGDGILVKILDHTNYFNQIDGRVNVQVKLDSPLPSEYDIRTTCWVSNISIAPVYFKTNLFLDKVTRKVYLNGVNFDVAVDKAYPTNDKYSEHSADTLLSAKTNLKLKYNDLLIDYNNFDNFIIYSSAELRTKIAKNKLTEYNAKESQKNNIQLKARLSSQAVISASYAEEKNKLMREQIALLNSFDEYESYLFFNTSSIDDKILDGVDYDNTNVDSLINQLPEYIKENEDYGDYLKFTAMVGHFFDNIMVYIKKFPKTYPLGFSENTDYPKNFLDELLNSFGWDTTSFKLQNSDITQYLFDQADTTGTLSSSYFDYGKRILNRFANNLPQIYKTKGTATSLDLITSLFGIPSGLIQTREYGSTDVNVNRINYFDFEDIVYLTKYDSNKYIAFNYTGSEYKYVQQPSFVITNTSSLEPDKPTYLTASYVLSEQFSGINTFEAAFKFNSTNYFEHDKIPLVRKTRNNHIDWEIYIRKTRQTESGKLIFEFHPIETNTTASLVSDELPYLNGDIFTFMVTRDIAPDYDYNYDTITPTVITSSVYGPYTSSSRQYFNSTASYTASLNEKYVPKVYKLAVNQYEGSLKNFESVTTKILSYNFNQHFSSGSYYVGNFNTNTPFVGNIDKIKMFINTLDILDFDEHSYNVDSISIPDKEFVYDNLVYLWSFDTPIDLWSHTSSVDFVWVPNQNVRYQVSGSPHTNAFKAYNFTGDTIVQGYPSCTPAVVSNFPYQFEKFTIKQAINSNNFGPNYKNNVKINKIDEYATSNLVPYDYSTKTNDIVGSDSNVVGYYISPFTYLENCMENFIGKEGITDVIGDPKYLTSQNYPELQARLAAFASTNRKYIYPQEYYTTYKFYIDFSVFDYVSKVVPNRATLKRGLLIEPSILERKKFNYRDINYNVNGMYTASFGFSNVAHLSSSYTTGSLMSVRVNSATDVDTDHNTYNFSRFEISDKIDDRDFIYARYGKNVFVDKRGFNIRNTYNVATNDYYQSVNNNGRIVGFTSSFYRVESIGSGSITGSAAFTNKYTGVESSGYSPRHLSKFSFAGGRSCYQAVSGSHYKIASGVKVDSDAKVKFYTYTKGKNDSSTTVNRKGLQNGSQPVITIPGFLSLNISSSNFPIYGTTTGSVTNPNSLFQAIPLTASMDNSASLDMYIMNL